MRSLTSFSRAMTKRTSFEREKATSSATRGSTRLDVASVTLLPSTPTQRTLYMRAMEAGMALTTSSSSSICERSTTSQPW